MSKTIAFFVRNIDPEKYPFSVRDLYYYSYQELLLAMKRAGLQAYFVTGNDTYLGGGKFSKAWSIERVCEVSDFQQVGEITADIVFNKGGFEGAGVSIVTDPRLEPLLGDKTATYKKFHHYQPLSIVCQSQRDVEAAILQMPGDMVVVKNPISSGGRQVYIAKKTQMAVPSDETYPLIVQEFIDMSDGIEGIAVGAHDVRLLLTGNTVIGATLREPVPGKLHANVSQGASERLLSFDEIPVEVRTMALNIDAQLEDLPRYYAIDFAKGKHGWKLVELNTRPGLFRADNGPLAVVFQESVARYLASLS
jgi:glutathione synthase/RimK-type ligase-like ATP-grasp enzyme